MTGDDNEVSESFVLDFEDVSGATEDVFVLSWSFMGQRSDKAGLGCRTI
jgi:hypothetical protein